MIQLVERLNTEYDVQNISARDAAEQALNSLTVSAWDKKRKRISNRFESQKWTTLGIQNLQPVKFS